MNDKYYKKYLKYYFKYKNLKQNGGAPYTKSYFLNQSIPHDFNFGNKNTRALVLPHAGSEYVNSVLSYAFSDIKRFSKILLLTTNHNDKHNYSLTDINGTIQNSEFFNTEHSHLSVQPYIERFNITPTLVAIGSFSDELVKTLLGLIDDNTLLIANTDLNHCGPQYNNTCSNVDETNKQIILDIINHSSQADNNLKNILLILNNIFLKLPYR